MKTFLIALLIIILIATFLLINSYTLSRRIYQLQDSLHRVSRSKDFYALPENTKRVEELRELWLRFSSTAKYCFHGDDIKNAEEYLQGLATSAKSDDFTDYLFYYESLERQMSLFQEFSSFSLSSIF